MFIIITLYFKTFLCQSFYEKCSAYLISRLLAQNSSKQKQNKKQHYRPRHFYRFDFCQKIGSLLTFELTWLKKLLLLKSFSETILSQPPPPPMIFFFSFVKFACLVQLKLYVSLCDF